MMASIGVYTGVIEALLVLRKSTKCIALLVLQLMQVLLTLKQVHSWARALEETKEGEDGVSVIYETGA